jgi:hypothetical protein
MGSYNPIATDDGVYRLSYHPILREGFFDHSAVGTITDWSTDARNLLLQLEGPFEGQRVDPWLLDIPFDTNNPQINEKVCLLYYR